MHQLVEKMFLAAFDAETSADRHDAAVFEMPAGRVAFTTDSYVVRPLFFPGGDIGSLAVHGTVNDLAMSGARARWLSAGFILQEGLPMDTLWRVVCSMRDAARRCDARIVTGDTKVIEQGKESGLFVNTTGIGEIHHSLTIAPSRIQVGDAILVNGDIARHGMAVMSAREGLEFGGTIQSDSAPVASLVLELLRQNIEIHCLRDLTRGGLGGVLNEIAGASKLGITIDEDSIPIREDVHAACEMLGLDPLLVACEGRFAAFVTKRDADRALEIMRGFDAEAGAKCIGAVQSKCPDTVVMRSGLGTLRIVDMPSGEQLPRIC